MRKCNNLTTSVILLNIFPSTTTKYSLFKQETMVLRYLMTVTYLTTVVFLTQEIGIMMLTKLIHLGYYSKMLDILISMY